MSTSDLLLLVKMRRDLAAGETKALRLRLLITQAELADACGVSQASIAAWETGRRRPTGTAAVRYAEALAGLREAEVKQVSVTESS